jgi:gluconate 2-dehydrogenase gamma chain
MGKLKNSKHKQKVDYTDNGQSGGGMSRRKFLFLAGSTSAVAVLAACAPAASTLTSTVTSTVTTTPATTSAPDTFMFFSAPEAAAVKAVCSRIIPSATGDPGAVEAKAYIYIDRALTGYLAGKSIGPGETLPMQTAYHRGLAAMDAYSQTKYQNNFASLTSTQQDAVLTDMQNGSTGTAFDAPSDQQFFNLLLTHTREGTFCDPLYGGNQGLVGWKMIGYPGSQVAYSDAQMAIGFDQSTVTPLLTLVEDEGISMPMPTGPSAGY